MRGKWHIVGDLVFFITLWIIFPRITISMVFISIMAAYAPDADQNFEMLGHRSFWSHNSLIWLIFFIFNPDVYLLTISLALGFHCLLDLRFTKQVGFYTIKILKINTGTLWYSKYRMNGTQTTAWLILNFIVPFIIMMWWCLV